MHHHLYICTFIYIILIYFIQMNMTYICYKNKKKMKYFKSIYKADNLKLFSQKFLYQHGIIMTFSKKRGVHTNHFVNLMTTIFSLNFKTQRGFECIDSLWKLSSILIKVGDWFFFLLIICESLNFLWLSTTLLNET